jgi:hypothetical protein
MKMEIGVPTVLSAVNLILEKNSPEDNVSDMIDT